MYAMQNAPTKEYASALISMTQWLKEVRGYQRNVLRKELL
jgi:hypothetical protein